MDTNRSSPGGDGDNRKKEPNNPSTNGQQTGVPSLRSPQAWYVPLLMDTKVSPSGGGRTLVSSPSTANQQTGVLSS